MAGQVKHNKIFSSIRPDWRLAKLLFSLPTKNTDSLIGAVARVLEDEGIELVDSTKFLRPLLPEAGVLTRRAAGRVRSRGHRLRPRSRAENCRTRSRPDGRGLATAPASPSKPWRAPTRPSNAPPASPAAAAPSSSSKSASPARICASTYPWSASKTIEVMQPLERYRLGHRRGTDSALRSRRIDSQPPTTSASPSRRSPPAAIA